MLTPNDVRIAIRQLHRAPGYTAATVATLALAIGATTVIASAVRAVLLRPLPIADPARLVVSWGSNPSLTSGVIELSYLDVADIQAAATAWLAPPPSHRLHGPRCWTAPAIP